MPSYDPRAVANIFLEKNNGPMNQMKLQKLVYIAHGWNLAINKKPLVETEIQAWDGGPVMRSIWDHIRDYGYNYKLRFFGDIEGNKLVCSLSVMEKSIIEHVWKKYGHYSGKKLSDMTHKEGTPWTNAYFGKGQNTKLDDQDIQEHFIELALAGRK